MNHERDVMLRPRDSAQRFQFVFLQIFFALVAATLSSESAVGQPWTNNTLLPEQQADLILSQMTFQEKVAMVHGVPGPYIGNITNNSRLGIPALHLQDGPAGIANSGIMGVTALPAPIALGATWDAELARRYGEMLGAEARGKGVHVLLAPLVNTLRVPQGGRNFEMLGEDPFLSSALAAAEIPGIQSQKVIACAKAFVCNDQETDRGLISVDVDERALKEIYYPPFLASVRAGAGSIMTAYNKVNGGWATEAPQLGTVLKAGWGFNGFTVCDWSASFTVTGGANNGLDLEMPQDQRFGDTLTNAIQAGSIDSSQLDEMVRRILAAMFRFGIFDDPTTNTVASVVTTPEHTQLARDAAAQGMVLLKNNNNLLPLDTNSVHSIAVLGSRAFADPIWVGNGSAWVYLSYYDIPLEAISNRAGTNILISYNRGDGGSITQAVALARQADVAIICVGQQTGEGADRTNLCLPGDQDALISAVAAANPRTAVVLYESSGTLMPWAENISSALVAWYPGQEGGRALASVLFGDVNPSGKLPVTFPMSSNQVPANTELQFPGLDHHVSYSESLRVGYRWYDSSNVAPRFPFGHGLSYTTFAFSNLTVSPVSPAGQVTITVEIKNTGNCDGAEVAQLYLGFPTNAGEPPKQLKGFSKVRLEPGETKRIEFNLIWEDLAFFDVGTQCWKVPLGAFQVYVGASSRDVRLTNSFAVPVPIRSNGLANRALFKQGMFSSGMINSANFAVTDGDLKTLWWPSNADPQSVTVDLGEIQQLARIRFKWQTNSAHSYTLSVSKDQTNWTVLTVASNRTSRVEDILASGKARWVQLSLTGSHLSNGALGELEVYSPELQLQPRLDLSLTQTNSLHVTWPSSWEGSFLKRNALLNWGNFILEQNTDLGSTNWVPVPEMAEAAGRTNHVLIAPSANRNFYRLRSPSTF